MEKKISKKSIDKIIDYFYKNKKINKNDVRKPVKRN